jgi:predicted nucleic acid-binding protein
MPGGDRFFVDSNVLLYSLDERLPEKQERARLGLTFLWKRGTGRLSWQVVHEFNANAERKTGSLGSLRAKSRRPSPNGSR